MASATPSGTARCTKRTPPPGSIASFAPWAGPNDTPADAMARGDRLVARVALDGGAQHGDRVAVSVGSDCGSPHVWLMREVDVDAADRDPHLAVDLVGVRPAQAQLEAEPRRPFAVDEAA